MPGISTPILSVTRQQAVQSRQHATDHHVHVWPRLGLAWARHVALTGCVRDWHTLQIHRAQKDVAGGSGGPPDC